MRSTSRSNLRAMQSDIDKLTKKIDAEPADPRLYWERARLYQVDRQWKLAIEDFSKAIALKPQEPVFWRDRGRLHSHVGPIGLYHNDLNRAIELAPGDADLYATRGWCRRLHHDNDDAVADFDRAIDLAPHEPHYRCRRGLVWLEKGGLRKAIEDFDEAIRLDPNDASFHYERASALLYENPHVRPEEALPDLEEAIRLNPDADWYRMSRGYIRFVQGRWAEAAEDLTRQDFRRFYSICPYEGAERVVWIYLARLFEGRPKLGTEAIAEYFDWYLKESAGHRKKQTPAAKLDTWPVPLARFLAGEIGEVQLFRRKDLDLTDEDRMRWDGDRIIGRIGECHFVLAELALARGLLDEARLQLKKASGLPPRNPISWVVFRQLASYG